MVFLMVFLKESHSAAYDRKSKLNWLGKDRRLFFSHVKEVGGRTLRLIWRHPSQQGLCFV